MKKILFSILLFIPVLAFAQNTVTVPGGSLPMTVGQTWRVTGTPTDSINKRYFMTFSGGSWNEIYTATYISKNFIRKGSEDSVVFSNQFKKSSGVVIINTDTIGIGRQYHISLDSATGNTRLDTNRWLQRYLSTDTRVQLNTHTLVFKGTTTQVVKIWPSGNVGINVTSGQGDNGYSVYVTNAGFNGYAQIGGLSVYPNNATATNGLISAYATKTANYTISNGAGSEVYYGDASFFGSPFTFTLPSAGAPYTGGVHYTFKKIDASANAITIATVSSQTIDGSTTFVLNNKNDFVSIISDGTNWKVISTNLISGGVTYTNFIFNETPSGTINGINSSFGLANTPQTGKVMVFKNGQLLNPTTDYTISGTTISMIIPPVTGSYLNVAYLK